MHCDTMIFGKVEIAEEFESELEAREEDYYYDAHAYYRNVFGGVEPVSWKVLAKSISETSWRFCKVMFDPGGAPGGTTKC